MFSVGTENVKILKYLGLDIIQNNKYDISLSQTKSIDEIKKIEITGDRSKQKHLDLNKEELKSFRALIGHLLWVSNQTRPDISFNLSELSSSVNHATVEHILRVNKVLKNAQIKPVTLTFPCMENLMQCKLVVYSEASYNNLENGGSQGGFCIFLQDSYGNLSLIMWQSKTI